MKYVDSLLDRITMYRLVVYALGVYVVLALIFSFMGRVSFSATAIVVSLGALIVPSFVTDKVLGRIFKTPTNSETWLITSLIMFFVLQPAHTKLGVLTLMVAGVVATASKFLLTWNDRHIFNPAALGIAVVSLTALHPSTWWIGNSAFWPFTLLIGLAIVRKIRRVPLFVVFVLVAVALQIILVVLHDQPLAAAIKGTLIASPLIFLSTIMLTEPATMPPRRNQQMIFAVLAAVLYITAWEIGPFIVYPEVALLLANVYAFAVSPKFHVRLKLKEIQKVSDRVYNYVFQPDRHFAFLPGQYMEWTLPGVPYDSRGNRRTLTIASSPTEQEVHVGIKYYQPASAFKATLFKMKIGDEIHASQLAGNFTINPNDDHKLAFIAGGIGVTPFRSMVKYLTDNNITRDIAMLYVVPEVAELAYRKELAAAAAVGVRCIPIVTREQADNSKAIHAKLSQSLLAQLIPDYSDRQFYISGPSNMVDATKHYLRNLKVHASHIKTDHFSGY